MLNKLVAVMRDRAACNSVTLRTIKIVYSSIVDEGYFSHTLDLVGGKFVTPCLSTFMVWWTSLFSHNPKAMLLWKEETGQSYKGYSATRWWSIYAVIRQVIDLFVDIQPFLEEVSVSPATVDKLLSILKDTQENMTLQVELAVTIDAGFPFVRATYNLEGDGPLALTCYDTINFEGEGPLVFCCYKSISALTAALNIGNYPNLNAVSQELSCGNAVTEQQLIAYGKTCINPSIQYYQQRLDDSMKIPLQAFNAARLFVPANTQAVNSLSVFLFFELEQLKTELPNYIAACADVDLSHDILTFWKNHARSLPHWSTAASKVVQPSSAVAERVFSILKRSFSDTQCGSLQDLIKISVMLQYNDRDV